MSATLYIPKVQTLSDDQNYQFLRTEGLNYIENLAHELWTDYNEHDPGITILELLCYAITELGYRSDFDMKDLLADKDGKTDVNQAFFSAKNILTNNPLTVEDFRKILIDTIGVSNAFLFPKESVKWEEGEEGIDDQVIPSTEIPFFPDCKKDALVYEKTEHDAIDVRGLYDVIVDLDDTEIYGDLNTGNISYAFTDGDLLGTNVEAILPAWRDADIKIINVIPGNISSITATENAAKDAWKIDMHYDDSGNDKTFTYTVRKTLSSPVKNIDTKITNELEKEVVQESILKLYKKKIQYTDAILHACWDKLHAHRDLCEDFLRIDTVKYTGIAVCCDIEVTNQADIDEVLGNVWYLIEQYFNPAVNFYLLSELVAKGIPTDEIFEGPVLEHGFIDTTELKNAQLRSEIRVSDIINLIMDIDGVVAVKNVLLTSYDENGNILQSGQKWCLHLEPYHKPVLDEFRSKILFFKDKLPFKAKLSEAFNVLRLLEANNERPKLKGHTDDLPIPTGTHYELGDYLTVQYDLPQTYGVSKYGLSNEVSSARKAQALQLRAYLMFYDQLLAGFFSQLSHAKDLLSLDETLTQTYFSQYLSDIKDVDKLYRNVQPSGSPDIFSLEDVLNGPVAGTTQHDINLNKLHSALIETEDVFDDRRNRFLDHLLGRFAETFNDYVFLLYTADKEKIASKELINEKILFLKDYPVISSERGKAYDQLLKSWDTDNVSGLEKRVSRFTGIHNFNQRSLFCYPDYEIKNAGTDADPKFEFIIFNKVHDPAYHSIKTYTSQTQAENAVNQVYENMFTKAQYKIAKNASNVFEIQLYNVEGIEIAVAEKTYQNNLGASQHLKYLINSLQPHCDAEGMHLIEHILLRPRFAPEPVAPETAEEDYELMQVCLDKDCVFCGEEDPYSFRASLLLPFWPMRFRDMDFRKYFENVVESESSAHIAVKVCWISFTSMKKFEDIFQEWLEALRDYAKDLKKDDDAKKLALKEANNKMIEFLKTVHSEYPEARLHDCEEGVTNPVRLGSTVLGSF
jgi:hypothetical protein